MNNRTKKLKQSLLRLETVEERLHFLKDSYKGTKAIILAPGPSLNDYDLTCLHDRDDLVILSIKQAQNNIYGQTDFHIVNTYNFDKYNGYDYANLNCIIFYGLSESFINQQMQKLAIKPHPVDIWVPVVNPPSITYEQSIHKAADFDKLLMLQKETKTWWGTSILYEQAIPMALLLGCKELVTIGWDLGTGVHSYNDDKVAFKVDNADIKRTQDSIDTTPQLYEWCLKNGVNLKICSSTNPADNRFERTEPCLI